MSAARVAGGSDGDTQWPVTNPDELDQRRNIDAAKYVDVQSAYHAEGEIRDGPTEYVSQDDHARQPSW